jgi:nucleoside 2-deoxyribosyltransferase
VRLRVVYLAGPFRASNQWEQEANIRRVEALALDVWTMGAVALAPHLNTRYFQGALPDDVWLYGDLELLNRCDAVLMVEGWGQSRGATTEHEFAKSHGIPIFYELAALRAWVAASVQVAAASQ